MAQIWEQAHGPIAAAMVVSTTCRNQICVNPAHIAVRTHSEQASFVAKPIDRCKSGRHDLTDPANVRRKINGTRQGCLPCLREKQRAYSAAEVADGRCAARKRRHAA